MTDEKDSALVHAAAKSAIERLSKAREIKVGTLDLRVPAQREGFQIWLEDAMVGVVATVRAEEREAAFSAIGNELRQYGAKHSQGGFTDLLERFQELFRELSSR